MQIRETSIRKRSRLPSLFSLTGIAIAAQLIIAGSGPKFTSGLVFARSAGSNAPSSTTQVESANPEPIPTEQAPAVATATDAASSVADSAGDSAGDSLGQQIFQEHCIRCHGDRGQGSEQHRDPLHGDLPIEDLARYIDETMPEEEPGLVVGDDARQVAQYIYDQFYSPAAQRLRSTSRVELSRLTVRQFQESVADLLGSFGDAPWSPEERGLSANYFASRHWTEDRQLSEQIDPTLDFAVGVPHFDASGNYPALVEKPKKPAENKMNEGFSVYWRGSLIAPDTGWYTLTVQSKNGFQFFLNDPDEPLIDRHVRSDDVLDHTAQVFLLGGRAYPLKLDFFSYPDPPPQIRLLWQPPHGVTEVIPTAYLIPHTMAATFSVATNFPADDASSGYERGTSVSQQWDESVTAAANETASWISAHLWRLAKTELAAADRNEKVQQFCHQFVERAFASPLNDEERQFFVDQHLAANLPLQDQVQRIVILTLKSPRFLFPEIQSRDRNFGMARRMALVLWDSLPDTKLYELAEQGKLTDPAVLDGELDRMIDDSRSRAKLRTFFHYWLKTNKAAVATKDQNIYPDFDGQLLADLRRSLDLYLEQVVWNGRSDFRELFLADYLFANQRLAKFYGLESAETGFVKIEAGPQQRAGILTHPYLMAGLAYHKDSSPIHRGVFVARNLLGRTLKQPAENFQPLTEEFDPSMTNRQRVEHQTQDTVCMSCHSVINPLGFSLENFDAVGRFRTAEKEKQINVSAAYKTPTGETVALAGPRDVANFLVADPTAQRSFIRQVFHSYVRQSVDAFGEQQLDQLHEKFIANEFNIRLLLLEITKVSLSLPNNPDHP